MKLISKVTIRTNLNGLQYIYVNDTNQNDNEIQLVKLHLVHFSDGTFITKGTFYFEYNSNPFCSKERYLNFKKTHNDWFYFYDCFDYSTNTIKKIKDEYETKIWVNKTTNEMTTIEPNTDRNLNRPYIMYITFENNKTVECYIPNYETELNLSINIFNGKYCVSVDEKI